MERTLRRRSVLAWKCRPPLPLAGGESQQPQNQRGQRGDEQQCFEALGAFRSSVAQSESPSVALEVANGLFDLHALGVDALYARAGSSVMRQRGGEQPRGAASVFG